MWKIIKAEWHYNRFKLVALYLATAGIWVSYFFDPAGMLALNGFTISVVTILAMRSDLKFHQRRKYRRLIEAGLVVAGFAYAGFKMSSHQNPEIYAYARDSFFYNPALAVLANVMAAGLIYWQAVIYSQRRSFLV